MTYCTITPLRIGEITVPGFMAGLVKQPRTELGVWAFLVEAGEKKILFDGGLVADIEITHRFVDEAIGPGFGYAAGDEASVRRALAAHGLGAEDIDVAVVSHLHHDHAGALDWLPRAQVWVHAHELEVLDSPYVMNVIPTWQITPGTRATLAKLESQSRLIAWDGERENLADGVELLRVGGHTKGSVALVGDVCADRRVALLGGSSPHRNPPRARCSADDRTRRLRDDSVRVQVAGGSRRTLAGPCRLRVGRSRCRRRLMATPDRMEGQ